MTAFALYRPAPPRDLRRWAPAALLVCAIHAGAFAAIVGWQASQPSPGATIPAVLIDMAPVSAAPQPQEQDLAPGPTMQEAEAPTPDAAPETAAEMIAPTPPQPQPVVAAPPEQKAKPTPEPVKPKARPVREVKKPSERPPAPRTTAQPRAERVAPTQNTAATGAAAAAAAASYRSMLAAHLQRFKQYPAGSRSIGETGVVTLSFTVNRGGHVLSSRIGRSSGHPALDAETMALIRRAQPLPAFPPEIREASMSFSVPIAYALR
ncbi:energy transducer TonB [Bradyrhizobium sp. U87765 SZCCT0131]|uniref:energy transducer TonB n=1 Tax=unclassified Bradyrhizobium TaxID=2631580 RepID=UPI001BA76E70|nr:MULTISPECIES: energy transducer TonB [unclassified Bradyrhizobium]MBR1221123.1 energy transducer TonB [Bradyrhizobium sp. U87765 SZCCT0131]MBR1260057.1 energy transducer TonB [Bradyrhizobium sp. U87765 SZCCT0134]MBR1307694.1 energy transducer TonB [Bradyrhizobium sp. U87765 SZCCT0110]MBR1321648.1 energy transducer TonB [Bradyrhizobium sp. U87765 SZCCT0109]MBR1349961.1 energy transducer TonB [Bradyrhizobium sp. U87765 SZCCT0048]